MAVPYLRQEAPASEELVARLEGRLGHPLPNTYRAYLRQHDGGRLANNDQAVNTIFSLGDVPDYASMWDRLDTYDGRVPTWLLPVARDEYGNLFTISLRDIDNGSVWFWNHEEEEMDDDLPPTEDDITRVADSWPQFLDGLAPVG
ncbi:SMI1/KNR4 family protein [Micromonospora sp. NPDC049044]|uniref:SMI1/KNR4 family protein n=1 Tax=unclassified Micromonospora TaxID=2617518 RepID=UPI0033D47C50